MGDVVAAPWGAFLLTTYDVCDHVLRSKTWLALDGEWRARQGDGNRWAAPASRELGRALQGLNPPHHTRFRRSVGHIFDRATLSRLRDPITRTVDRLLDELAVRMRDGEADFADLVGEELPVASMGLWLDLPRADYPLLRHLAHEQGYAQELLPSASQIARSNAATLGLRDYFGALVRERRASPGDDIVSGWLRTWDELEDGDQDAADEAVYLLTMFLVIAALETSSTFLSGMVWTLDQHPDQLNWLRSNPQEVPGAVEELLRYDAPVHLTTRAAAEDTVLAGVPIAKDQLVHTLIASANHDPARTTDPEVFDIRRPGRHLSHLAFGGGIHYCIGAGLARLQAHALLEGILRRFPTLRVSVPPVWEPRVAFRRLTALQVVDH
ncbi:cytochrome P450 [Streptomyces specialis]|uniref:cytochrome P450 n=1 Tax=Streptomyces specialis TaxID=498367 RepID=UPI00073EE6F2|nr:cytochrome P450 [Streptomyces specialis]